MRRGEKARCKKLDFIMELELLEVRAELILSDANDQRTPWVGLHDGRVTKKRLRTAPPKSQVATERATVTGLVKLYSEPPAAVPRALFALPDEDGGIAPATSAPGPDGAVARTWEDFEVWVLVVVSGEW